MQNHKKKHRLLYIKLNTLRPKQNNRYFADVILKAFSSMKIVNVTIFSEVYSLESS